MAERSKFYPDFGAGPSPHPIEVTLGIDSTLQALPLHYACLEATTLGQEVAHLFNRLPTLPGIFLIERGAVVGMLSRQRFLEFLLRPKGCELFLSEPVSLIHAYARLGPLVLSENTLIVTAARAAFRRPMELQGEPVWVKISGGDRLLNIHDLNQAFWQIRGIETQVRYERTQTAMLQIQKMAALGRLVDGIAHEMMDPLGFVWGNLSHVEHYCQQLLDLIAAYKQSSQGTLPEVQALEEAVELEYLREDLPNALLSIRGGAVRLKQLASSLQNFCYIDEVYPKSADLHSLIDSIVLLLKSRFTTQITITRQYAPLPPIPCFAGQLSQALMNVLSYCVDNLLSLTARQSVMADHMASALASQAVLRSPQILIKTQLRDGIEGTPAPLGDRWLILTIGHNGPGLSPAALQHIQDSFSVEQRLERETDLATSYRLITAKHGGRFSVRSPATHCPAFLPHSGTEFIIEMPIYDGAGAPPPMKENR